MHHWTPETRIGLERERLAAFNGKSSLRQQALRADWLIYI